MSTLSADDFVKAIQGFDQLSPSTQTDLLALYSLEHGGVSEITAGKLASLREALHLTAQARLPQYLSEQTKRRGKSLGRYIKKSSGYALERGFATELKKTYLGRPSAQNVSASLQGTLTAIGDPAVRSYLEEAITAFEQNLLRASIILTWCVAYGLFRSWLYRNHLAVINNVMSQWKVPFQISTLDDFQELTESVVIENSRKAKVITKEQHKTLKTLLDQRNSYAHPTTKIVSPAISEAYLDTVLREVVPTFG